MDDKHVKMIEDIHTALVGNEYNDEGIIKRVSKIEEKVDKQEISIKIGLGLIVAISFLAAFWGDIKSIFQ